MRPHEDRIVVVVVVVDVVVVDVVDFVVVVVVVVVAVAMTRKFKMPFHSVALTKSADET